MTPVAAAPVHARMAPIQAHGRRAGRARISLSSRWASGWFGRRRTASSSFGSAAPALPAKKAPSAGHQTSLKRLRASIATPVSLRKSRTVSAGMMKLKPCTISVRPSGSTVTNVSTPARIPESTTAGPPLLPHEAGASVWITGFSATSFLNPETVPFDTVASTFVDWLRSS